MNKLKIILIITISILLGVFIGKNISKRKIVYITNGIIESNMIDTNYSELANKELYNYISNYYDTKNSKLPDYYVDIDNDTIQYNKEIFFYYYSLFKINKYLSEGKSIIIQNLLTEKDTIK